VLRTAQDIQIEPNASLRFQHCCKECCAAYSTIWQVQAHCSGTALAPHIKSTDDRSHNCPEPTQAWVTSTLSACHRNMRIHKILVPSNPPLEAQANTTGQMSIQAECTNQLHLKSGSNEPATRSQKPDRWHYYALMGQTMASKMLRKLKKKLFLSCISGPVSV
jgi:hypothetical protein